MCASQCTTCSVTKLNCTLCADGMYLQNNSCVSQCATGFKPDRTRTCLYCGSSCGSSLDFTTNITQINGQNTIFVTFNNSVTINGDPSTVFTLQQVSRRRMLQSGYQIIVVDSTTIKIIIPNNVNASQFTVKIVKP